MSNGGNCQWHPDREARYEVIIAPPNPQLLTCEECADAMGLFNPDQKLLEIFTVVDLEGTYFKANTQSGMIS